ncbi:rhodanese-like domain-containing protein [Gracilibacillus thailandensis]|uniref:Rhodanese-like domain-containing protein n=1 Tax=Gracilibacillus thailandensis TaxID=563735 RepID=A0A6N7QWU8_9BACI|nr:rhodanese-like domain-containing protein [Gracilibacillus thailandensis]MRI66014.1 rhodanese-like domain-containing protein [Gracilibacillus thailandensis]
MEYLLYIVYSSFLVFILKRFLPMKGIKNMTTAELRKQLKDKDKQFIDVRTPREFKGNHISNFKNLPLHELSEKASKQLSPEKEVVIICQSGMRSKKAAKTLKKLGFNQVANVKGGMSAWK